MKIMLKLFVFLLFVGCYGCQQLAVYWGQDPAGGMRLLVEKGIEDYCVNYDYDIIPVAFLDIFFDMNNKDNYPGLNLANHCNTTFYGYPDLLNCTLIASQIKTCQKHGRKIILSLGGAAGLYGFTSSSQAITFANTIWNLFLGGESNVQPFKGVSLDGVDLDIEAGGTKYYVDFIRALRQLMKTDNSKNYIITGAPQCPYPDVIMGPGTRGTVLYDIPQEFDYLFVQFYNNYCYLGAFAQFNASISQWFEFAEKTKTKYGSGPQIFIGLPSHPRASSGSQYYRTPQEVQEVYEPLRSNRNLGGIMLWDASFDLNNVIDGRHYSEYLKEFLQAPPEIAICGFPIPYDYEPESEKKKENKKFNFKWMGWVIFGIICLSFALMGYIIYNLRVSRQLKERLHGLKYHQPEEI